MLFLNCDVLWHVDGKAHVLNQVLKSLISGFCFFFTLLNTFFSSILVTPLKFHAKSSTVVLHIIFQWLPIKFDQSKVSVLIDHANRVILYSFCLMHWLCYQDLCWWLLETGYIPTTIVRFTMIFKTVALVSVGSSTYTTHIINTVVCKCQF